MRKITLFSSLLLLAGGCTNNNAVNALKPVTLSEGLHAFRSCDDTVAYFKAMADYEMTLQLEAQKHWVGQCKFYMADAEKTSMASANQAAAPTAAPAFSTTNNQVKDVDEADLVKTIARDLDHDGTNDEIYQLIARAPMYQNGALTAGTLEIVRVYAADKTKIGKLTSLTIDAAPQELLVSGDTALVISRAQIDAFKRPGEMTSDALMWPGYFYGNAVRLSVVDISDLSAPKVVHERSVEGNYLTARLIGTGARVITTARVAGPALQYWPSDHSLDGLSQCDPSPAARARFVAAYDRLIAQNRRAIAAAQARDWLPARVDDGGEALPLACGALLRPGEPAGRGITAVTTIDLQIAKTATAFSEVAVVADGEHAYASPGALYVATNPFDAAYWARVYALHANAQDLSDTKWVELPPERTTIHKFKMPAPAETTYAATGAVDGMLVDQFAIDEARGYLRVASTLNRYVGWGERPMTNQLSVLKSDGDSLSLAAAVKDLQKGERIYAARFFDTRGFIVTAKNVDPLLSFDLSDPLHPAQKGALEVPGISTYLHPMDDTHLIAIGRGATPAETGQAQSGWLNGVKLAIYDVGDLAHPREAQSTTLGAGDEYVWSEAVSEHKAFTYFSTTVAGKPMNVLAFPVNVYGSPNRCNMYNCYQDGLRVYRVDLDAGFTALGDVYHNSFATEASWGNEAVRRAVVMGDQVISVSNLGLKITRIAALGTPSPLSAEQEIAIKF